MFQEGKDTDLEMNLIEDNNIQLHNHLKLKIDHHYNNNPLDIVYSHLMILNWFDLNMNQEDMEPQRDFLIDSSHLVSIR